MHELDDNRVWWLWNILLLIVLFKEVLFSLVFFLVLFTSFASRCPEHFMLQSLWSDDCAMTGLPISLPCEAWLHYTSACNTHGATLKLNTFYLWSPEDKMYVYMDGSVLCCWWETVFQFKLASYYVLWVSPHLTSSVCMSLKDLSVQLTSISQNALDWIWRRRHMRTVFMFEWKAIEKKDPGVKHY